MTTEHLGASEHRAHGGATLPYLPGVDGLRALAVAMVFAYHAVGAPFRGGFLGVDLFFVISGYLITGGLLTEWQHQGRIRPLAFWARRARRLLPAALTLILVVLAIVAATLPEEIHSTRAGALAAVGFMTNWFLVLRNAPYFETIGRPPLLQHLWSLAVEEQFYLVWPLFLSAALRWLRPGTVLTLVVVLAIASSVLMYGLYQLGADPARLYFGTDTHATGLLVGAALAFLWRPGAPGPAPSRRLDMIGDAALLGVIGSVFILDQSQPLLYTGGFAVIALLSAVSVLVAARPGTHLAALLGTRPLRWLGTRSYSVYLWHWPVLTLTQPGVDVTLQGLPLLALQVALTLALAEASYRWIEQPVRGGVITRAIAALRRLPSNPSLRGDATFIGGVSTLALLGALIAMVATAPPVRPPAYAAATPVRGVLVAPTANTPDAPAEAAIPASAVARAIPDTGGDSAPPVADPVPANVAAGGIRPVDYVPGTPPVVMAIGDSVMLGAATELARAFGAVDLDAQEGRSIIDVLRIIRERQEASTLTPTVIVHTGNNGPLTAVQVEQLLQPLSGVTRVLVVNVHVPRPWEVPNRNILATVTRRFPNAVLVDWHGYSTQRPEFFYDDQTHLTPEGATAYAELLAVRAGLAIDAGSVTRQPLPTSVEIPVVPAR